MGRRVVMAGSRYGKLTAIEELPMERAMRKWRLICDCGNTVDALQKRFVYERGLRSCGCSTPRQEHHGKSEYPEYTVWKQMKYRCLNSNATGYSKYGGRGITVCEQWRRSFERFLQDVGPRPSMKHTLDRIDNDKGYMPGNVRWVEQKIQQRNKSNNRIVEVDGECTTLAEAVEKRGLNYNTVFFRIKRGKTPQEALR